MMIKYIIPLLLVFLFCFNSFLYDTYNLNNSNQWLIISNYDWKKKQRWKENRIPISNSTKWRQKVVIPLRVPPYNLFHFRLRTAKPYDPLSGMQVEIRFNISCIIYIIFAAIYAYMWWENIKHHVIYGKGLNTKT